MSPIASSSSNSPRSAVQTFNTHTYLPEQPTWRRWQESNTGSRWPRWCRTSVPGLGRACLEWSEERAPRIVPRGACASTHSWWTAARLCSERWTWRPSTPTPDTKTTSKWRTLTPRITAVALPLTCTDVTQHFTTPCSYVLPVILTNFCYFCNRHIGYRLCSLWGRHTIYAEATPFRPDQVWATKPFVGFSRNFAGEFNTKICRTTVSLIFVVPSIMLYSSEISPTRCNNCVFVLRNGFTLEVSGDNLTHHQEYICCIWPYTAYEVC